MFERWISVGTEKSCLIIGPRRCGKTTFLRQRYPDYRYATLDDLDFLDWAQKDPKGFVSSLGKRAIIDEIQRSPRLTVAVKYAVDNEGAHVIMTGSSSVGLLDSAADTLAGRIDIYSLPTACFGEDLSKPTHSIFEPLDHISGKQSSRLLSSAIKYGQFPEVLTRTDDAARDKVLSNYKSTYFTRDLMQMANLENLDGLSSVLHNLVRSIGSHLDVSNFSREAGISHATAKKYLNTLEQSQLTFRLLGYQFGPTKKYIKAAKTYFCDNGVIQALGGNASEGQLIENFVIAEFEKRRKLGLIKCDQLHYYKSAGGREIDLVFEHGGKLFAIEIKANRNPDRRDTRNLREFRRKMEKPVECYLFHLGDTDEMVDGVGLNPIYSLFTAGGL